MATGKITNRSVAAAAPGERDTYLWDADLPGFGLKVTPAGRKVYLVQYRNGGRRGRTRRVTIGKHGSPWTPDGARKVAKRILGRVAAGEDPAEERSEARRDLSITELCDLYLREGVATKKPSTLAVDRGRIERHIKPLLGRRRLLALTRGEIERFMQDVAAGKTAIDIKTGARGRAIVRGGKGTASKAVALLGSILTFAVDHKLRPDNPARGIKRYRDKKCERFLAPAELARLGAALATVERDGENPFVVAAIRLLALTGCRKSEILGLQWAQIDFERACIRFPESKTGAKALPLGAPALEVLEALPRIEGCPYVLPASIGNGHFVGLQKAWVRIRAKAALEDVRLHDLRHSFAAAGAAGGDSLLMIGALLGHRDPTTTSRYAHLADDPLKEAADRISGAIAAAMKGDGDGAQVVELRGRKA